MATSFVLLETKLRPTTEAIDSPLEQIPPLEGFPEPDPEPDLVPEPQPASEPDPEPSLEPTLPPELNPEAPA